MTGRNFREARSDRAISGLVDLRILQPGGELLGTVDELLIDPRDGRIAYVIARCGNGDRKSIPWHLLHCTGNEFRLREPLSASNADRGSTRRRDGES